MIFFLLFYQENKTKVKPNLKQMMFCSGISCQHCLFQCALPLVLAMFLPVHCPVPGCEHKISYGCVPGFMEGLMPFTTNQLLLWSCNPCVCPSSHHGTVQKGNTPAYALCLESLENMAGDTK